MFCRVRGVGVEEELGFRLKPLLGVLSPADGASALLAWGLGLF
jgi:hypothetical protein